jgi:hypothetical protein
MKGTDGRWYLRSIVLRAGQHKRMFVDRSPASILDKPGRFVLMAGKNGNRQCSL